MISQITHHTLFVVLSLFACNCCPIKKTQSKSSEFLLVRIRGFEPPWSCPHTDLNRARLPIPPYPQVFCFPWRDYFIIHRFAIFAIFLDFFRSFFCHFPNPFILQGFGWVYLMIQNYPFIPDFTAAFFGLKPPGSNPRFLIRTRILSEVISSLNIICLVKFILHQCQVYDLKS